MSQLRQHAEWLSLIDVSGPFLSMPVLKRVFPQGLDALDKDKKRDLKRALDDWEIAHHDATIHREWVRFVLRNLLDFPEGQVLLEGAAIPTALQVAFPMHHETLAPDMLICNPSHHPQPDAPRLLVSIYPPHQKLNQPIKDAAWKAAPAARMMELLQGTSTKLGLVTNGDTFLIVHAPRGETVSYVRFYAQLWREEPITLTAFASLLCARRFFAVSPEDTLEAMFAESANNQEEVTNQLGLQVRRAVEVLVQAIDLIDLDRNRQLLQGVDETVLYQASVTVMMRLVFLLAAEERGLLLPHNDIYQAHYAISTLRDQLREEADKFGEKVLETRNDAWSRLLATFRAVYGGMKHDKMQLPAHGGSIFDPDRFPFLEGRPLGSQWHKEDASPLPINNRTVLHLLDAIQVLETRIGGVTEARKLSFRSLEPEQIGYVYEGLLDHTAKRAHCPILGLQGTKNKEAEVPLDTLEALASQGEKELVKFLKGETGRGASPLKKALNKYEIDDPQPWLVACESEAVYERIRPYAGLVRTDTYGEPLIFGEGSIYVTHGTDRRATGTHYTPKVLTEEVVRYTLEPLVYHGPAEGLDPNQWQLHSAKDILALRVCDIAMGSGAFLVQACRYLAERLLEAWEAVEQQHPGEIIITPDGAVSSADAAEALLPAGAEERMLLAKRYIAEQCLYGVDINPMATELAKLSLWLETLQKDRPFTFLDHALRCGDSLLGLHQRAQLEQFHIAPANRDNPDQLDMFAERFAPMLQEGINQRLKLLHIESLDIRDVREKARLHQAAETAMESMRVAADLITGTALVHAGSKGKALDAQLEALSFRMLAALNETDATKTQQALSLLRDEATALLAQQKEPGHPERRPFHWILAFPEIFLDASRGGFDAIVGNPPFMGGSRITGVIGTDYRNYLIDCVASGKKGNADLCAFFFLQIHKLLTAKGCFGAIATNTISQGDTRETGLAQMREQGVSFYRAIPSRTWPGGANLEIAEVWGRKAGWRGRCCLAVKNASGELELSVVRGINDLLDVPGRIEGKPFRLDANQGKSFIGNKVYGEGFVLEPEHARELIEKDAKNAEVLFPYLNGADLNSHPKQEPSRWVINFGQMTLEEASEYTDVMDIVRRLVKPYRDTVKRKHTRENWWLHEHSRTALYQAIEKAGLVLAKTQVSPTWAFAKSHTRIVFDQKVIVITDTALLPVLESTFHYVWSWRNSSTMGATSLTYTVKSCLEPFPFPKRMKPLEDIGQRYYEHRQAIMEATQLGLTKTYNRFHDPEDQSEDIQQLRALHIEMDQAVAEAYDWFDEQTLAKHPDWEPLDLAHDFYDTPQGIRFTISPDARREVLDRLLELNHTRYAAEKKKGLHTKKSKGKSKKNKNNKKPKETPKKATPKANPKADNIELFASLPEVLPPARPKESHTSTDPEGE